jgi:phage virion morphogenesis protein
MTIEIGVRGNKVVSVVQLAAERLGDLSEPMRAIAGILLDATEQNFADGGRPAWLPLAPATIAQRTKDGTWPGQILQRTGRLAASVTIDSGADFAVVGSNVVYAAIQQLGGEAGRGRKVAIPARPFLPVSPSGAIQPAEVVTQILEVLQEALAAGAAGAGGGGAGIA